MAGRVSGHGLGLFDSSLTRTRSQTSGCEWVRDESGGLTREKVKEGVNGYAR